MHTTFGADVKDSWFVYRAEVNRNVGQINLWNVYVLNLECTVLVWVNYIGKA